LRRGEEEGTHQVEEHDPLLRDSVVEENLDSLDDGSSGGELGKNERGKKRRRSELEFKSWRRWF